jgi:predicted RecA/RadA family phage recombinase
MKNYIQPGETITLTAPYAVSSGGGALVGSIFGVAVGDVANGAQGEFRTTGVYSLAKETGAAWAVGDLIYWDNTEKRCTKTATSNKLIGVAVAAAASGDGVGRVRLNGAFIS